jgi:hypothetical protein
VASAAVFTRAFRLAFRPGFVGFRRSFCSRGRTPGNRDLDVNNPVFQAVIGPFVVAFLVVGASRIVVWPTGSEVLVGLGLAAGLLGAFVQLRGIPSLPPNSAPEKLFYLITLGGLIGVALDLLGRPPLIGRLAFVLFPAICLAWFGLRPLLAGPDVWLWRCHAGGSLLDVRGRFSRGYEENQLRRISVPA